MVFWNGLRTAYVNVNQVASSACGISEFRAVRLAAAVLQTSFVWLLPRQFSARQYRWLCGISSHIVSAPITAC